MKRNGRKRKPKVDPFRLLIAINRELARLGKLRQS